MPAGGFRTFVAGEVLDENDINDYLMQGVLVFSGTAARGSAISVPVEGQFAFLTDSDTLTYYDGSAWQEYVGGLNWAPVASATGTFSTGTVVDGEKTWVYYKFTGAGTVTFSDSGYADLLVVGGGAGGELDGEFGASGGGGAGAVRWGVQEVAGTAYAVTVGTGGSPGQENTAGSSSFGNILKAGGGRGPRISGDQAAITQQAHGGGGSTGGLYATDGSTALNGAGQGGTVYGSNNYDGITLNYDGVSREYGKGGTSVDAVANTGGGGRVGNYSGAAGVVIVRVQI